MLNFCNVSDGAGDTQSNLRRILFQEAASSNNKNYQFTNTSAEDASLINDEETIDHLYIDYDILTNIGDTLNDTITAEDTLEDSKANIASLEEENVTTESSKFETTNLSVTESDSTTHHDMFQSEVWL